MKLRRQMLKGKKKKLAHRSSWGERKFGSCRRWVHGVNRTCDWAISVVCYGQHVKSDAALLVFWQRHHSRKWRYSWWLKDEKDLFATCGFVLWLNVYGQPLTVFETFTDSVPPEMVVFKQVFFAVNVMVYVCPLTSVPDVLTAPVKKL